MIHQLTLKSGERTQLLARHGWRGARVTSGCCDVLEHTTAGITVNGGADPAVKRDIASRLDRPVPDAHYFTHAEGSSC